MVIIAYLEEFTEYKQKLMKAICTSKDITSLLRLPDEKHLADQDFPYLRVFPYNYVPETSEKAQSFVCFDVEAPSIQNGAFKIVHLYVWVFCHKSLMRMPDGSGIRRDLLASTVDKLLNGNADYGFNRMELNYNRLRHITDGYYGRESRYEVKDFNRICRAI